MVKTQSLRKIILLLYLAVFPFGQIPALLITLSLHSLISIHFADFFALLFVVLSFVEKRTLIKDFIYSDVFKFVVILLFSYVFGMLYFDIVYLQSFLYLLRACTYVMFAYILWKDRIVSSQEISIFFIMNALIISVSGLIQYLLLPDTRFLKILGWDDHYFRLISTFLDPAFTGILLVLSLLFMGLYWRPKSNLVKGISIAVVSISLLLTYSRASFLSLLAGLVVYTFLQRKIKLKYVIATILFVFTLTLLPRPDGGEGVKLERTFSIISKFQNSSETIALGKASPLFGVGYNNLCYVKNSNNLDTSAVLFSHSCSGADNSLVFIFATMGIVGVLFVTWGIIQLIKSNKNPFVLSVFTAVLLHTQFTNTLFYPWVCMWIVLCLCLRPITEEK